MKAIFYDRKHDCEVSNEELMFINAVDTIALTQDNSEQRFNKTITGCSEKCIGELGYMDRGKIEKGINWNRYLMYTDLVFLRFEDN